MTRSRVFQRWGKTGGAFYGRRWTLWTATNAGPRAWQIDHNVTSPDDVRTIQVAYAQVTTGGRIWYVGRRLRGFDARPAVTVADRGVW
jgi:hypothetical protein